ncbi:hypothetical protein ACJX0J_032948 [Zea mays]
MDLYQFGFMTSYKSQHQHVELFDLLKASEEPLHEYTTITILTFVTQLITSELDIDFDVFVNVVNKDGKIVTMPLIPLVKCLWHKKEIGDFFKIPRMINFAAFSIF